MDQRLMPDVLDIREITYTNLLLLDFRPDIFEAKHHCPFTRDAFVFPNKKAMEEVFYFLFTKLNPGIAKEEFRHCWPIHDKKQESAFRKVSVQYLNRLNKEVHDSNIPRVVASALMSPGGDKFYYLLFCFSSFVLKEEVRKILHKDEVILPWPTTSSTAKTFPHQTSKLLTAKIILETERFLRNASLSSKAQDKWVQFASELTKENRAIRKRRREVEKEVKNLESEHLKRGLLSPASGRPSSRHHSPYSGQIKSLKRTKILQRVRGYWKRISEMYESHKILRGKIDQIILGSANKCVLRAADIDIKIPDLLLRECEEEIYQRRIGNTFESGRVNLLSLVQLLNLSLHLILEQIRSHKLPSVPEEEADVRDKLHAQSAYLQTTQSLKDIIEKEMIPELNDSVAELQEMIQFSHSLKHFTPKTNRKVDFSLIGLPVTPSVRLDAELDSDQRREALTFHKDLFASDNVITPDAVERLVKSLRESTVNTSPTDEIGKKENVEKPPPRSTAKKLGVPNQALKHKIPVPRAKSTSKHKVKKIGVINPRDVGSTHQETAKEKEGLGQKQHHSMEINANDGILVSSENRIRMGEAGNQSTGETIARDILADKIAFSVSTKDEVIRSSSSSSSNSRSSSRCQTPMEHGLEDPISAMSKDAFIARDKIHRTPLKQGSRAEERRKSHDALQSYLGKTLPRESDATPKLAQQSFTETPKNSLFDNSLSNETPDITQSDERDSKKSDRRMRFGVNDFDLDSYAFESPRFDEEAQTPLINRVIESSVRRSVLRPNDLHYSLEDKDSPYKTNTKYESSEENTVPIAMPPFDNEGRLTSHSPSLPPFSNEDRATEPDGMIEPGVTVKPGSKEMEPTVEERSLSKNGARTPKSRHEQILRQEHDSSSSSKDGLAEIIMRYKNLKMKSQKQGFSDNKGLADDQGNLYRQYDTRRVLQQDQRSEHYNSSPLLGKETTKHDVNEFGVMTPSLSTDLIGDAPSQNGRSFFEIARNSAKKDIATWSSLKKHITSHDEYDDVLNSNYDSFDDLQLPVARQLSFLQVDTREISHTPRLENHLLVAREQKDPTGIVGDKDDKDIFSYTTSDYPLNLDNIELAIMPIEGANGLSSNIREEADPLKRQSYNQDERNRSGLRNELLGRGSSVEDLKKLTSELNSSKMPFKDTIADSVDEYFTKKQKQKPIFSDVTMDYSLFETPTFKNTDDSFNILTPGLELQRGVDLFALDGESSGLDGGYHGLERKPLQQDINLIDF